jgi:hypothetical protein
MAAILKVHGRGWIQESYETGDPDIKKRAKELRARGYRVVSESMGSQVTQYGRLKMTLMDIRPGTSGDSYLEQVNPRRRRTNAGPFSLRKTKKRIKGLLRSSAPSPRQRRQIKEALGPGYKKRFAKSGPGLWRTPQEVRFNAVKGRKVKGGRAVTVRNFTGTIVRRSDGSVDILGKGRRR